MEVRRFGLSRKIGDGELSPERSSHLAVDIMPDIRNFERRMPERLAPKRQLMF